MEEKSLINKGKLNIFQKIGKIIKQLFYKEVKKENVEILNNNERTTIFDDFEREKEILKLQQEYERGELLENELSDAQKNELLQLYEKQIKTLEENVRKYEKQLEFSKNKIIEKREKLKMNN